MSKRPVILMAVLLVLVAAFVGRSLWLPESPGPSASQPAGKISEVQVRKGTDGRWIASVAYEYRSDWQDALVRVYPLRADVAALPPDAARGALDAAASRGAFRTAAPGAHRIDIELARPYEPALAFATTHLEVRLHMGSRVLATQRVEQAIDWPDWNVWLQGRSQAGKTSDDHLREAIALIDLGGRGQLMEAKRMLEQLIARDARYDPAYVELARVAMKSNWGPEGLRQAEGLLASALQIRPDSVDARILQGYVYAHQGRHRDAEALFESAAKTDTRNLWLWANWGEVLAMQGRLEPAIAKYREAVTRPRTHDTYDRARLDAYAKLIDLLDERNDTDGVEALHRQRVAEFGPGSCHNAAYARFLLHRRGDGAAALAQARQAVDGSCGNDEGRQALGLAHYVTWASATGAARDDALRQARVYFPAGPNLMYQLASSEATLKAAKALKAEGAEVDMLDNAGFNALSYALDRNDLATARQLLRLGAKTDTPIGPDKMPVALLPVVRGSFEGIRLMQQFGTDYARLTYQGATAIEHAKRMGDQRLLEALGRSTRS
jgi:tetratricopeptide (TPR) repeat protein